MTQFDNVLEALLSPMDTNLNNPCDPALATEKNNHNTPHVSSTDVDQQTIVANGTTNNTGTEVSPQARVRISVTATTAEAETSPIVSSVSQQSILQSASTSDTQESNPFISDNEASQSKGHLKEIHDHTNKLFHIFSENSMKQTSFHVADFAGLYPVWPIVKFSMAPIGMAKDERMNSFTKCITALLREILQVDDMVKIATILITDDESRYISSKADLPTNFTKLGQHFMICGGSWVFNKKEKGSNNVYARFRLKSQVKTEEIINCVSFEFTHLGGKNLYKKQHQAMETETPLVLLFVCNGMDQASIVLDTKQMLDTALDDIEQNGMLPKEFKKNKDIPHFTIRLNVPCLPAKTKSSKNREYDHFKKHGKKAFHFKVTKEEVNYFKYLSANAHRMKLNVKYFGKVANFTGTLGNNALLSDCIHLH
jgi:hypothetical protein